MEKLDPEDVIVRFVPLAVLLAAAVRPSGVPGAVSIGPSAASLVVTVMPWSAELSVITSAPLVVIVPVTLPGRVCAVTAAEIALFRSANVFPPTAVVKVNVSPVALSWMVVTDPGVRAVLPDSPV